MTSYSTQPKQFDDKTYFVSPLRTLYQGLQNPMAVSVYDLIEAYATFHNRVRVVAKHLDGRANLLPPALLILQDYGAALGKSLRRDLELKSIDDESMATLHLYALRVTSDVLRFPSLYRVMEAYSSKILSQIYAILCRPLSTLLERRSQSIGWFVLRGLTIPYEDLFLSHKSSRGIYTACCHGLLFVPGEQPTYDAPFANDALLTVDNILSRYLDAFLKFTEESIKLFGKVCLHLFHSSLDIRACAMRTICTFARTKVQARLRPDATVCGLMSEVLFKAITRWTWYDPPSPPPTPYDTTQIKQLSPEDFHQLFNIPISAFSSAWDGPRHQPKPVVSFLAALIVLLDSSIFVQSNRKRCRAFFRKSFDLIQNSASLESQQLAKLLWCAQLWVWARCPPQEREMSAFIAESSCITAQAFVGYARPMAGVLVGWKGFGPSSIRNGSQLFFSIISRLLKSKNSPIAMEAAEVFCEVLPSPQSDSPKLSRNPFDPLTTFILRLLDPSFSNDRSVVTPSNDLFPFKASSLREFSEQEVDEQWEHFLQIWILCVESWIRSQDSSLEDMLLGAWRVLYLARSQVIVGSQEHRHTAPAPALGALTSALEHLLQPSMVSTRAQVRGLGLVERAWHSLQTTFSHYPHHSLTQPATSLLTRLLQRDYSLHDLSVRTMITNLTCRLLPEITFLCQDSTTPFKQGTPSKSVLQKFQCRTTWVLEVHHMAQTQSLNGKTWDSTALLLSQVFMPAPFTPTLCESEMQDFRQVLSQVFQEAKVLDRTSEIANIFLSSLGSSTQTKGDLLDPLLLLLIQYELDLAPFFKWLIDRMTKAYQDNALSEFNLVPILTSALQKLSTTALPPVLQVLSPGLTLLISDLNEKLSPEQHKHHTFPLYLEILDTLRKLPSSREVLIQSTSLLVSPFHCPHVGTEAAAQAFCRFWTSHFHEHRREIGRYVNEDLRTVLLACNKFGHNFCDGLESQNTEGETSGSIVPDSHPLPEETSHERAERAQWGLPEDTKGFHGLPRRVSMSTNASTGHMISGKHENGLALSYPLHPADCVPSPRTPARTHHRSYKNDDTPSINTRKRQNSGFSSQRKRRRLAGAQSSPLLPSVEFPDHSVAYSRSQSVPILKDRERAAIGPSSHRQNGDSQPPSSQDTSFPTTPNVIEEDQEDYGSWEIAVDPDTVQSFSGGGSDSGISLDREDEQDEDENDHMDILPMHSKEILTTPHASPVVQPHIQPCSTGVSLNDSQFRHARVEVLDAAHTAVFRHGGTQEESFEELLRQQTLAIGIAKGCQERLERKVAEMHSRSPLL